MELLSQVLLSCVFYFILTWYVKHKNQRQLVLHWPLIGVLPQLVLNMHNINVWLADVFVSLRTRTIHLKGPVFSKLEYLVTCDPENLRYVLKTNFTNFPKGPEFNEKFDVLGDGIFNADFDSWSTQREMAHSCFRSAEFRAFLADITRKIVQDKLIPLLILMASKGSSFDLQDVLSRFTFETTIAATYGRDSGYLSPEFPTNEFVEAVDNAEEAILYRFAVPAFVWKLMRWLKVGREKKYAEAWATADAFLGEFISQTREELLQGVETNTILAIYIKSPKQISDKFLRDSMLTFNLAGRDTTTVGLSWFFWLVCKNPHVEAKILEELGVVFSAKMNKAAAAGDEGNIQTRVWPWVFDEGDVKGLVYLHAAFCESLRLYPPVPLNSKGVLKEDTLPDGSVVRPGMQIILSHYAVGRMPWIWGDNCLEFKPERWIRDDGTLDLQLMSNLFAFSNGPRTCVGKQMAFTQMKLAAATLLFNFHIELVEGQSVSIKPSLVSLMNPGLMVRVKERGRGVR
ncbi:PREDICTED: cytochrome P450 86B1-like [Nelumbo nucifera]|uniref:Alkane hydroxylase MAH1-like n=2 Tax=Nelumbo nucifera TaxID=4432 RepID=A0A822ZCF4_NELNU|nr:PREDICTED: cytochrome P450 86B1-like [Nelumbo nucifera]DAD41361.1 TPA_asm: hypothetical protein HUJ06_015684 [Nelumbo nucifera]